MFRCRQSERTSERDIERKRENDWETDRNKRIKSNLFYCYINFFPAHPTATICFDCIKHLDSSEQVPLLLHWLAIETKKAASTNVCIYENALHLLSWVMSRLKWKTWGFVERSCTKFTLGSRQYGNKIDVILLKAKEREQKSRISNTQKWMQFSHSD